MYLGTRIPDGRRKLKSLAAKQLYNHKDVYDSDAWGLGYGLTHAAEFVIFWAWENEAPMKSLRSMDRKGVADG